MNPSTQIPAASVAAIQPFTDAAGLTVADFVEAILADLIEDTATSIPADPSKPLAGVPGLILDAWDFPPDRKAAIEQRMRQALTRKRETTQPTTAGLPA